MTTFSSFNLSHETLKALEKKGFEEATPIQAKVIPLILNSKVDIIGQAQTGTGKTAAFGLPLLELVHEKNPHTQAVILVPTRELALQVSEEINSFKGKRHLNIVPIYGGQSFNEQFRRLKLGAHIVVGTPGRVIDHLERKTLSLEHVNYFVLDEADEMLNMGFIDDVELILKNTAKNKRVFLFSATMPKRLAQIAERYMGQKESVSIEKTQLTTQLTHQIYFEVAERDKLEALCRIIDIEDDFYGVIFCRTKVEVDQVTHQLTNRGYRAEGLHGDISQHFREKILEKFRQRRINILVATDVAARGIDIQDLTHVINYSLPQNPESYVHRIGRTGRAGKQGTAITFVTPQEYRNLLFIKRITKTEIHKQKVPTKSVVIEKKMDRIVNAVAEVISNKQYEPYLSLAKKLTELDKHEVVLASIIQHAFARDLDETRYRDIEDVAIDTKGKTRLFIALGKTDGMTPIKLEKFLKQKTGIENMQIRNPEIYDRFSFINVPFEQAELILHSFKKDKGRSIVTRARKK